MNVEKNLRLLALSVVIPADQEAIFVIIAANNYKNQKKSLLLITPEESFINLGHWTE